MFAVDWYTFSGWFSSVPKIKITLKIEDVDASSWDDTGQMGYWMAIGFGKSVMLNSDIIICKYKYTNNFFNDGFTCSDTFGKPSSPGDSAH